MSGTSLDGVDIAHCFFKHDNKKWKFEILHAETISYSDEWRNRLNDLHYSDALTFIKTHAELGKYYGLLINNFIEKHTIKPGLICSHGHTIFHQPGNGFTSQIGEGAQIAAATGIDTVCDFRSKDVALGGQGAPLVPIGDRLLFGEYDFCLNLGGFANISFEKNNQRIAFDICPVNMALNSLAAEAGLIYDDKGALAAAGIINNKILEKLNQLEFYSQPPPKSLGKEWFEKYFELVIQATSVTIKEHLRTVTEHIAQQIAAVISLQISPADSSVQKVLVTGGGAHNTFLVNCISSKTKAKLIVPEKKLVDFKEALIFAFLGVMRINNEINILQSVTGSAKDHIGGAVYSGR